MVQIGQIQVELERQEVRTDGEIVNIGSRAFGILEALIRARGVLVSKDEIMRAVWPDTIVEENNIHVQIGILRKVLGKDRGLIRTVSGRGYVLVQAPGEQADSLTMLTMAPSPIAVDCSTLIGREFSVSEVSDLLQNKRAITLVGAGGIGKTRLAAEVASHVASHFPGGVAFVALASVSDGRSVLDSLAAALGIKASAGRVSLQDIFSETAGRRILIVLDNCEHVIDAAAELSESLTANICEICVLATSREALRTRGETLYRVPPLDSPDENTSKRDALLSSSVQLFLARARAVDAKFPSDDRTIALVGLVCRRLDGIPLAIELAGARAATLGIEVLAEHLDDRFRILAGGRRTALPRHQTLKATFDWSYRLLDDLERALFRRLGVFVNGFSFNAAFHVLKSQQFTQAEVLYALSGLVSKSLVIHDSTNTSRYRLLESSRAYALQQMEDNGERKSASSAHAVYFRDLFDHPQDSWEEQPAECRLISFSNEVGNLRTALDWSLAKGGDLEVGIALSAAAVPYFFELSLVEECADRARVALHAIRDLRRHPSMQVETLRLLSAYAAALAYTQGPSDGVWYAWTEVLSLARAKQDIHFESRAIWGLWNTKQYRGNARDALVQARRFSTLAQRSGNAIHVLLARRAEGIAMHYVGDQWTARERLESVVASYVPNVHRWQTLGFQFDHGIAARATLARVLWLQGETTAALRHSKDAVDAAMIYGNDMMTCYVLVEALVPIALLTGDLALANRGLAVLRLQSCRAGFAIWSACCNAYDEYLKSMSDETGNRKSNFRAAIEELKSVQFLSPLTFILCQYARSLLTSGDINEALSAVNEAFTQSDTTGERWYFSELCRIRAHIALASLQEDEDEAEAWLLTAFENASQQGAYGLARLAADSLRQCGFQSTIPCECGSLSL
jgi:predicted ATPase/DNA-binding winged helix-turn-helix (wHTH) protein